MFMIFIDFQGSVGQKVSHLKGPVRGPTRRLVIQAWTWIFIIFIDSQGSAGQEVSHLKGPAVGPTRRLVIQAWIHGFS